MLSHFDTIVAPITGSGTAAVAVVRLSGPEAWKVAAEVFSPWRPEAMRAAYGRYRHGDDGLALPFQEGHSYTGEESVELSIHGSSESVRELVEACIRAGARMAEPGEFTQRAFLNGRIDLTQAEAVRDLIESRTAAQLRLANLQREGSLKRRIAAIRDHVFKVLASIEAAVDFSEEIGDLDREEASRMLQECLERIDGLLETAGVDRILRHGLRVAIVGRPNAGKSSLLNAILGIDRAIVTEFPGTTRDFVEEQIEVNGFPVVLIDTAGLRDSEDRIESLGVQRTRAIASGADQIWYVYDASVGWTEEDEAFVAPTGSDQSLTIVANKRDLIRNSPPLGPNAVTPQGRNAATPQAGNAVTPQGRNAAAPQPILVSAVTGDGLPSLLNSLPIDRDIAFREVAINTRHADLLANTRESVATARETLTSERPTDLASVLLQEAMGALGQITGETASPDMITRIFSDFCIGK